MKRGHDAAMEAVAASTVLCCSCGVPMVANQTMRCAQCLKAEVSIIDGISRQVVLSHCRTCKRYNKPPWTACEFESRELLGICLKRIKGLGKDVRLVDASFIWTEEHSRRIRVKITVQKEVAHSSVLQQTMVVEFQVVNQQCEECQKSFTPHGFNAIVQVRQKVAHRRTFCYLEQLILKNDAHDKVLSLKENSEGLDFFFGQRSHAQRFADFVCATVPSKVKTSRHLLSHDASSNMYHYKYTLLCELCPVCVDDVVVVPRGLSDKLSGAPPTLLCHKVSNGVRLVDPMTLRGYDIASTEYWKRPLDQIVCTRKNLTEFVVLNVEPLETPETGTPAKHHRFGKGKMVLADIEVARAADFGVNDDRLIVRSHLGSVLKPGTHALGYDMRTVNVSGLDNDPIDEDRRPDVVLVKKFYRKRRGRRNWQLQRLDRTKEEGDQDVDDEADMEAVRQDLEEDPELRRAVNLFRVPDAASKPQTSAAGVAAENGGEAGARQEQAEDGGEGEDDDDDDEDALEVPLAELLEGLQLGGEGAAEVQMPAAV